MSKSQLKAAVVAGIAAILLAIVVSVVPTARPLNVTVTSNGLTNIPGFGPAAAFCISNGGKDSLYVTMLPPSYEYKSQIMDRSKNQDANSLWNISMSHPRFLKPGQSGPVCVALPRGNPEPWRIVFGFVKVDWRLRMARLPAWVNDLSNRIFPQRWRIVVPQLRVATDWVTNSELKDVSFEKK